MQPTWRLTGKQARLATPWGDLVTDMARPDQGCQVAGAGSFLQLHLPSGTSHEIAECYVRGSDLVVTYAEDSQAVRAQVYWRASQDGPDSLGLSLIVSVQTNLLDSQPATHVVSQSPAEVLRTNAQEGGTFVEVSESQSFSATEPAPCFVFRLVDRQISYAVAVHPSDFAGGEIEIENEEPRLRYFLFPEVLEKGVIRRARITSAWTVRDGDLDLASKLWMRAENEAPPLTT